MTQACVTLSALTSHGDSQRKYRYSAAIEHTPTCFGDWNYDSVILG